MGERWVTRGGWNLVDIDHQDDGHKTQKAFLLISSFQDSSHPTGGNPKAKKISTPTSALTPIWSGLEDEKGTAQPFKSSHEVSSL